MVQQVETVEGRRRILRGGRRFQPGPAGTSGDLPYFFVTVPVPLLPGDLFKLFDRIQELRTDVGDLRIGDFVIRIEGDIDHDHRDVQLSCEVLIPFDHAVADIVAAEHIVRQRHRLFRCFRPARIGQRDPGIGADIIGITLSFGNGTQAFAAASGSDRCSLILGIADIESQRFRDLDREVAGAPADQFPAGFRFRHIVIGLLRDHIQLVFG